MAALNLYPSDREAVSAMIRIDDGQVFNGDLYVPDLKVGVVQEGQTVRYREYSRSPWKKVKVAFVEAPDKVFCRSIDPLA